MNRCFASRDFAPGIDNVVLRRNGKEYYAIETFHRSDLINKVIPVLVRDVVKSVDLTDIYGIGALSLAKQHIIMVNNHPLKHLKIAGRVVDFSYKTIWRKEYLMIIIDDCSGYLITAMVLQSTVFAAGVNIETLVGKLVQVSGYLNKYHETYELRSSHLELLDNSNKLVSEINWWNQVLEFRNNVLAKPWTQTHQLNDENDMGVVLMNVNDQQKKLMKRQLQLTEVDQAESLQVSAKIVDSIYIHKSKQSKVTEVEEDDPNETSSDVEELTEEMFIESVILPFYSRLTTKDDWVPVTKELKYDQCFLPFTTEHFQFEFVRWIYTNNKLHFNLNEPFNDKSLLKLLNLISDKEFPIQVIDLTSDSHQIKTKLEINGEVFHKSRHHLTNSNLIQCNKSNECFTINLFQFLKKIQNELKSLKNLNINNNNQLTLILHNYIPIYNKSNDLNSKNKINLQLNIFIPIIHWLILLENDANWYFNPQLLQITYLS